MLRRTRERFERLEQMYASIMSKLSEHPAPPATDAAGVLAQAFGQVAGNQAEMVKAFGDIAIKTAARRMGIRGGTKRALTGERDDRGKFRRGSLRLADRRGGGGCPLCRDPNYRDVTVPMIQAHRQHEADRQARLNEPIDVEVQDEPTTEGNGTNSFAPTGTA